MKFKFFTKTIFLFLITLFTSTQSYIFNLEVYNNKLFCLGDVHLGMSENFPHPDMSFQQVFNTNKTQIDDLVNFIKKNIKNNDYIIISEDLFDCPFEKYKMNYVASRQQCLQQNFSTIFDFLNKTSNDLNLQYINVEFRQIAEMFFSLQLGTEEFLEYFENIIKEFRNYDDGEYLNNYYKNTLDNFLKTFDGFINSLYNNKSKRLHQITNDENIFQKKHFITDFRRLLDLKILHTIYQNKNKHIFLVAGNGHILRIKEVLPSIGYKLTSTTENSIYEPLNLKKSLKPSFIEKLSFNPLNSSNKLLLITIIAADLLLKLGYVLMKRIQLRKKINS